MMANNQRSTSLLEVILIDYRWVFVCFFLLPISFVYNFVYFVRNVIVFRLNSAPRNHDNKVKYIQQQVEKWRESGRKKKMCTARPGWQTMSFRRPLYKENLYQIECNLIDILAVDTARKIIRCEPLATMGQISATLAPLGWTLAIVPELDDLTVGGLVMGTGVESSSHIYGLFQNICVSFELVMCDGTIVHCSRTADADLFDAIPWSYGTLGLLTAVELQIIPATQYVRLHYRPIRGLDTIVRTFQQLTLSGNNDFVEALQYGLDEAVIMTGNMVADADVDATAINDISKWYKPWFFTHVRAMLDNDAAADVVEYVPLRAYHHRHSRALFWELQDIVPFGNALVFRWLLGWMMPVKVSLLKITQSAAIKRLYEQHHVIQDFMVPTSQMRRCLRECDRAVQVYPLWLCPFMLWQSPGMVHPAAGLPADMYVDIGVYGVPKRATFSAMRTHRELEDLVVRCGGFQMLYGDTYRTRQEFRTMFDHRLYDRMRSRLRCADAFPEVYDKICKSARD